MYTNVDVHMYLLRISINSKLAYMLKYAYMVPLAIKDSVSILRYLL